MYIQLSYTVRCVYCQAASVIETVRDINVASRIIGDMSGGTLDDPLFDRYKKLGCSISPLEKESEDYAMILKYVEKTYEPVKVGEIVRITCYTFSNKLVNQVAHLISNLMFSCSGGFRAMECLWRTYFKWK